MNFGAPQKFAGIFTQLAHYSRMAHDIEKREGHLPVADQQRLCSGWANDILQILGIRVDVRGSIHKTSEPQLFVGNHLSYLDIPLLMAHAPVVFVSKEEVGRWPLIGTAGRRAGTVFVKRESNSSRLVASQTIARAITENKQSVAIFPSGTTCLTESKPWRTGAFKIALEHKVPVQPFRLRYTPARPVAFIDDDMLAPHLWRLLRQGHLTAELEFGVPQLIEDPIKDSQRLWRWAQEIHSHPQGMH